MSSNAQLSGYGTVNVVDETAEMINEATGSWVEANVILTAKLIDEKEAEEASHSASVNTADINSAPDKPVYRDVGFALLFLIHLATFIVVGIFYGSFDVNVGTEDSPSSTSTADQFDNIDGGNLVQMMAILSTSALVAFLVTYSITALILPKYPALAIQSSLLGNVIMFSVFGLLLFISYPNIWTLIVFIVLAGVNFWYYISVQRFIPFATTNLKMATRAISTNFGIYFVAFGTAIIGAVWFAFWAYTATGLGLFSDIEVAASQTAAESNYYTYYDKGVTTTVLGLKGFFLLLSLYWTITVLANIVQTTTAGVTGTWCFDTTNASSCCSSAVSTSLIRSCTYSFGSICFGSLLAALVTTLRVMAQWARDNADNRDNQGAQLLFCILTCILAFIEDIVEYFNQWAYIFVGIWGLNYLESGKRVMELFVARGCTAIISNGLANYVLTNVALLTSIISGFVAYLVGGNGGSFLVGFLVGLIISASMMAIVQGAVKAVIVCYVDHPHKLYANHPEETVAFAQAIEFAYPTILIPVFTNTTI